MTTKVTKKESTEVATDTRPDWMKAGDNMGNENVSNNDLIIPRLQIIQDLSPQGKKNKPEYIDGAEVGMVFNTVSGALYDLPLVFIPVHYEVEYNIWKDQSAGGGFFGSFPSEQEANAELVKLVNQGEINNGQAEVVDTYVHYVLIKQGNTYEEAVISMSKSQAKISRQFNTMVKMAGGARFSRVYALNVVEDQNKAGQEYYNWKINPKGFVGSEAEYNKAKEIYEAINSGMRKVDRTESTGDSKPKSEAKQEPAGDELDEF
tara:strand:+ start:20520 stop:21305 length:786 start_codon:yes stop_codon:yes gene_type:complete